MSLNTRIAAHPIRWAFILAFTVLLTLVGVGLVGLHLQQDHQNVHALVVRAICQDQPSLPLCQPVKPAAVGGNTPSAPPPAATTTPPAPAPTTAPKKSGG